ncbi:alpha/beta fold hydrolase [Microbacterium sp. JZ31]|uniref:alpha/beta fold hydrolase n=1 Tax=Microbacterium sp. JZ31 TaxID=1906274 RepID=UPI001EE3AF2A|nr:alpha/beta hydrolase [Microbacterium sp. JZ31]
MTENDAALAAADARDEFSFLPGQAAHLGVATPTARRVHAALADGRIVSALLFGESAPRVVLLHGAGLNAHTWDTTTLALGAPALVLDLPGHGDSSWREDADYRPRTLAPDAIRTIEEWADAPVVLVGHSLGGLTAAAVAAARPDLVAALLLVDITPGAAGGAGSAELRRFYEQTVFASREEVVERAMAFGLGGSLEDTRRGVFHNTRVLPAGPDGRSTVEWKHHFARLAHQALAAPAPAEASAPLVDATGWDDLAAVAAPVTLVRGTRGFVDDAAADDFARRLPSATVVTLDAPHNVQEVAPGALAALVSAHLDDAGTAGRPPSATPHPLAPHPTAAPDGTADDPTADAP